MPMRTDCKHYESRTYATGESVRTCSIDKAPEAPWRCPDPCPFFAKRSAVAWSYGSMAETVPPPPEPELDEAALEALDDVEAILDEAGAKVLAEMAEKEHKKGLRNKFKGKRKKR